MISLRLSGIALVLAVAAGLVAACGSDSDDDTNTNTTAPATLSFATDINPIIVKSCGGTDCHGVGTTASGATAYENNEAAFKASPSTTYITNGLMPKEGGGKTLSAADKTTLLNFLAQ